MQVLQVDPEEVFLKLNSESLDQLVTFLDFAPERLTLGFVSINFLRDQVFLLDAIRQDIRCQDVQLAVLHFPDPDLRFLRDAVLAELPKIEQEVGKKLVLAITGLEYSIGMLGDYPLILQDLNYVRDAFTASVPYPILICLPDSALTRLARYAPDFWAWRMAVFQFKSSTAAVNRAMEQAADTNYQISSLPLSEKREKVDSLLRLLNEYPVNGHSKTLEQQHIHLRILNQLGSLYYSLGETKKAKDIFEQVLYVAAEDEHLIKAHAWNNLNAIQRNSEKFELLREEEDFLDAQSPEKFVGQFIGRRRALQRCLRALKPTSDRIGVFIQGMAGLGKSRLAARLCGRVQAQRQNMQRVVLIGVLDELGLLNKLGNQYDQFHEIPALLNQPGVGLKGRLKNFFEAIEAIDRPLILVLDDFEQNIPETAILEGSLRLISQAYEVLTELCRAIEETEADSRLIITCRYKCPLPSRRLHLETLDRMSDADIDKKCRSIPGYVQVQQHPGYWRVLRIADGNPRLLEWLLKPLEDDSVDSAVLLDHLEKRALVFRESILTETLLRALTGDEQRFLAQMSAIRLPISLGLVNAIVGVPLLGLKKMLALSLVESSLRSPNQEVEYRVTKILEPLLLPLLTEAEWQKTWQRAAQELYRVWWEEAEGASEVQMLEIVRLGLLSREQAIVVKVGGDLAERWVNNSRFVEALEICQAILAVFEDDYRILGAIARTEEVLGESGDAIAHYQKALALCSDDDDLKQAATLNNMASVIANQGDIDRALDLWQQSLEIKERIGDVQGKATTLANMAYVAGERGDRPRQLTLNIQAAQALGQVRAYRDLFTVLCNLGATAEENPLAYLAQAIWLSLKIQVPLSANIQLIAALFSAIPQGEPLESLLATTANFLCQRRGESHPQLPQLQEFSFKMLSSAASAQGITTPEDFEAWMTRSQLNDPAVFLPRLNQRLEDLVGDGWLFEREGL